ncbi:MAG: hypothetical protein EXR28_16445 [Betaproteobacteria bacterium]|nr:hypothetical protein [Betaproteobacteria bacterium]
MRFLLLLLIICSGALRAEVEIIPLRHRTVDQVIPVLRPLVEPGGALSGAQGQLIIRASLANIADLKRVLASIDTPQRRLLISVRQDLEGSDSNRAAGVSGSVGIGSVTIRNEPGGAARERRIDAEALNAQGVNVRLGEASTRRDERVDQQVQALDGMPAFISTGQSQPQPTRNVTRAPDGALIVTDSVSYRDVSTGFEVVPRVSGERVFLDINPRRETPGPGGTLNVQRMSTSASARLGEWFEIGGLAISSNTQSSGILSSSNAQRQENRRVWVKVEEQK